MSPQTRHLIYWLSTVLLCAQMTLAAVAYFTPAPAASQAFARLGYPPYFQVMLGVAKLAGVVALLVPRFPLLKEWAYAGFTFTLVAAVVSHALNHEIPQIIPPVAAIVVLTISYACRPDRRRPVESRVGSGS